MISSTLILCCFICVILSSFAEESIINKEVSQIIDATGATVKYSVEVKATNVAGEYSFVFNNNWATHLAFISVVSKGEKLNVHPPVRYESQNNKFDNICLLCYSSKDNYTIISVDVQEHSPTLKLKATFSDILNPYPTAITQLENQFVILEGNHYFLSPYKTLTQKTVFKLASSTVESFTKLSPYSVRGSNIHFGPFKDIAPLSVRILYLNIYSANFLYVVFNSNCALFA